MKERMMPGWWNTVRKDFRGLGRGAAFGVVLLAVFFAEGGALGLDAPARFHGEAGLSPATLDVLNDVAAKPLVVGETPLQTLPTMGLVGLCVVIGVCILAGAFIILRK